MVVVAEAKMSLRVVRARCRVLEASSDLLQRPHVEPVANDAGIERHYVLVGSVVSRGLLALSKEWEVAQLLEVLL